MRNCEMETLPITVSDWVRGVILLRVVVDSAVHAIETDLFRSSSSVDRYRDSFWTSTLAACLQIRQKECVFKNQNLSQPKHMLWVRKITIVVVVCFLWHFSAAYKLIVQSPLVLFHLLQNS